MSSARRIVGIDLGTTNSCVASVVGGYPQVIPNAQGYKTTPSVVAYLEDERILVGQHAKRQALINPKNTIYSSKRLIGRRWNSPEANRGKALYGYDLAPGPADSIFAKVGERVLTLPEVSAQILTEMRKVASSFLAAEVKDAVITVPAYFNDGQRQATKMAGEMAGLNVVRIINEPTAAALAYGFAKKKNSVVAVYDLGGGTFDISVLEIRNGVFRVLATDGDTFLGGDDFDGILIDHLVNEFQKSANVDLKQDRIALQRIKDAAEKAKCDLSTLKETRVQLPFLAGEGDKGLHLDVWITREQFEGMCAGLINKTLDVCREVLRQAGLDKEDIHDVLLVGGQTRMPKIHDSVSNLFGRSASKQIHPDEAVAVGAAVHADSLFSDSSETLLLDVTPMALGIRTAGNTFNQLIKKNTTVPTSQSHVFTTVADNQQNVKIQVYQGDSPVASENTLLGEFLLTGIRKAPAGEPEIEVEFAIDANGIVQVSASDRETGLAHSIVITTGEEKGEEEISTNSHNVDPTVEENWSDEVEQFSLRLADQSEAEELKQEIRLALHRLRKEYEKWNSQIDAQMQKRVLHLLDNGPAFVNESGIDGLNRLRREIKTVSQAMKQTGSQ